MGKGGAPPNGVRMDTTPGTEDSANSSEKAEGRGQTLSSSTQLLMFVLPQGLLHFNSAKSIFIHIFFTRLAVGTEGRA